MCVSTATTAAASRTRTTSTAHCHTVQGHASLSLMELTLAPGRAAFLASRSRCDSTLLPVCNPELRVDGVDGVLAGPGEREAVVGRACTTNATTMYFFLAVRSKPKALRTRQRTTAGAGTVSGGPRTAGSHRGGGALEDSWQPPLIARIHAQEHRAPGCPGCVVAVTKAGRHGDSHRPGCDTGRTHSLRPRSLRPRSLSPLTAGVCEPQDPFRWEESSMRKLPALGCTWSPSNSPKPTGRASWWSM